MELRIDVYPGQFILHLFIEEEPDDGIIITIENDTESFSYESPKLQPQPPEDSYLIRSTAGFKPGVYKFKIEGNGYLISQAITIDPTA